MPEAMNGRVLRLLDANANRAREALRVMEDYARFVLDDAGLSGELKAIRHGLAEALAGVSARAILFRDTPGDAGTANKTVSEFRRAGIADVVTAAGKRLGEALRAIEEYLKTISPADASRVEALRYAGYELERRLALTLRPAGRFADVRLYVLITESACRLPWLAAAGEALLGGADCLQLREKSLESGELLRRARQLTDLCHRHGKLCVVNDRPDVALLAGADGVHVGQTDLPAAEVRKLIGPDMLLGVSTHHLGQARQAVLDGADYIGVGPVFPSATKPRDFVAGVEFARQVSEHIPLPAVAIAGITADNVAEVLNAGIKAIAVTAAVVGSENPRQAAAELKKRLVTPRSESPVGQTFLSAAQGLGQNKVGQTFLSAGQESAQNPVGRTFLSASGRGPDPTVHKRRRRLPHWTMEGATYFLTFRLKHGQLSIAERKLVLDHVRSGSDRFYQLVAAVVMPDHVHLLLTPEPKVDLTRICKGMKGVTARLINTARKEQGPIWQVETWDRIVRDQNELDQKLSYMFDNPVRKGLADDGWNYDGWYYNESRGGDGPADENSKDAEDGHGRDC